MHTNSIERDCDSPRESEHRSWIKHHEQLILVRRSNSSVKIVLVSLASAIIILAFGINARLVESNTATVVANMHGVGLRAGQPTTVSANDLFRVADATGGRVEIDAPIEYPPDFV